MIDKIVEFYKKGDYMISRDKYLKQLIDSKDNGFPKVITGIRRCGKSFLMKDRCWKTSFTMNFVIRVIL